MDPLLRGLGIEPLWEVRGSVATSLSAFGWDGLSRWIEAQGKAFSRGMLLPSVEVPPVAAWPTCVTAWHVEMDNK